jgi:surfactin synthase thioesterase subunit
MWIKPIMEMASSRQHLLCVPWAGAGPEAFMPWRTALPAGVAMSAVHLPGRTTRYREPLVSSTPAIVEQVVRALLAAPSLPTTIFGHSFGAVVAFEICRRLEREGQAPARLVVSGSSAPPVVMREERVAHLPSAEFLAKVAAYGALPEELLANPQLCDVFAAILRADFAALESYRFEDPRPLSRPIVALGGRTDPAVSLEGLEAWHQMSDVHCEVRLFDGDHFYFMGRERGVLEVILGG